MPASPSGTPGACPSRRKGRGRLTSPDARRLAALLCVLFLPVTLARQAGGRRAAGLKPRLPENVPEGELVGDVPHRLDVAFGGPLHGGHDLPEPRLARRRHRGSLPGVFGKVKEQRRVMAGDETAVAEAHLRGEAAVGARGAELGREEEGFPHGRACGTQEQELVSGARDRYPRGAPKTLKTERAIADGICVSLARRTKG